MSTARIALDAFGGDHCPQHEIDGAVEAARQGVHVVLVGDERTLKQHAAKIPDFESLPILIRHAPDRIAMDDTPAKAVRAKPEASMPVCFDLVRQGEASAVMSAGNSGAMLACGLFKYRRIKGVDRPALVGSLPTRKGGFVSFLDVGANVDCRPINLVQFAVLGAVYAQFKHDRERPRVGLLSNGTEDKKGNELTRASHQILDAGPCHGFEYVGNVEGGDLFSGDVDVVVTDGFTGNVALKIAEATGRLIGGWLRDAIGEGVRTKLGALLLRPAFMDLRSMLNPDSYGSAPLLGVSGMAFICHGGSSPHAIATSLKFAARSVDASVHTRLRDAIEQHRPMFVAAKEIELTSAER